jgi:hypothetical protein
MDTATFRITPRVTLFLRPCEAQKKAEHGSPEGSKLPIFTVNAWPESTPEPNEVFRETMPIKAGFRARSLSVDLT